MRKWGFGINVVLPNTFIMHLCFHSIHCGGQRSLQAPVVQTLDSTIHRVHHYPAYKINIREINYAIQWIVIYLIG